MTSVKQRMLIFEKPGEGWKSGAAESKKDAPAAAAAAPPGAKSDLSDLLGALRTGMASVEKDYLKPTARGVCVTCKQNVTGDLLLCRDRVFHPEHFQCTGCSKRLGTDSFYYKDSTSQYCEACYTSKLTPMCLSCEKPISGRHTYWNGAPYHIECFTCSRCDAAIDTKMFAVVNSAPFCLKCEGGSMTDSRDSAHRAGTCTECGTRGEDNYCEKCGGVMEFE